MLRNPRYLTEAFAAMQTSPRLAGIYQSFGASPPAAPASIHWFPSQDRTAEPLDAAVSEIIDGQQVHATAVSAAMKGALLTISVPATPNPESWQAAEQIADRVQLALRDTFGAQDQDYQVGAGYWPNAPSAERLLYVLPIWIRCAVIDVEPARTPLSLLLTSGSATAEVDLSVPR